MAPMKRPAAPEHLDPFEDSHSLTHLAHRWHVPRRKIRDLLKSGELPFVDLEGQLRVPDPAVREYERELQREDRRSLSL